MKLFIANTTKQPHIFQYQHPEQGLRKIEIKAGNQIVIDNVTSDVAGKIVQQYDIYGIQDAEKMSRKKGFVGFCYRMDKPVPMDAMLTNYEDNGKALALQAQERLVVEAAAVQDGIAENLHKLTGADKEQVRPNHLEIETTEETGDGSRPSIATGVEVTRNPGDAPRHKQRRQ